VCVYRMPTYENFHMRRAYFVEESPSGVQRQSPWSGGQAAKPPEAETLLRSKRQSKAAASQFSSFPGQVLLSEGRGTCPLTMPTGAHGAKLKDILRS